MKTITVQSQLKHYPIYIENGLLDRLNEVIPNEKHVVIIHDDHIPITIVEKVKRALPNHLEISFPQGEASKSLETYHQIMKTLLSNGMTRDVTVIALGGGVTGDLAGYVAATYLRGVGLIQIPTTLLAQIDSSVGGKVAINLESAKNIIGSFYPPDLVLIDPQVLATLDPRQFANGMSEMIKYGMIADRALFDQLQKQDVRSFLLDAIVQSVSIKKRFVEADEHDRGIRMMLNFGHTIGHALEAYYHYEKYNHGEAVAIGMVRAIANIGVAEKLKSLLLKYELPTSDPVANRDLLDWIIKDKKNQTGFIRLIDVAQIGQAFIRKVSIDSFQ